MGRREESWGGARSREEGGEGFEEGEGWAKNALAEQDTTNSWRNIAFTILCVVQDQVVFVDPRRFHGDGAALLYTTHRPTAQLQRSFCTSASGKHVQALHEIELSLKFLPYCPSSLFWRGFLLLKDGARVDDAYECFKLLLKINDEWLDLVGDFARVFFVVFPF